MFAVLELQDYFWIMLIVLAAASSLSVYRKRKERARMSHMEAKLDLLLKSAGVAYDPRATVPPGVWEAIRGSNKIEAIKLYCQATGAGIAEAKEFVEELQAMPKA
jgi:ribosomal protein L7/L12